MLEKTRVVLNRLNLDAKHSGRWSSGGLMKMPFRKHLLREDKLYRTEIGKLRSLNKPMKPQRVMKHANGRSTRESFREAMDYMRGPLSREELIDLYHNPEAPEEEKPPGEIIEGYLKFENIKNLSQEKRVRKEVGNFSHDFNYRVSKTFRSRVAKKKVTDDLHGYSRYDDGNKMFYHTHVHTFPVLNWKVAPVTWGSQRSRYIFGKKSTCEVTDICFNPAEFPRPDLPEVVFLGEELSGKSTLINTLMNRVLLPMKLDGYERNDSRRSASQTAFLKLGSTAGNIVLVDVPGYTNVLRSGTAKQDILSQTTGYLKSRCSFSKSDKKKLRLCIYCIRPLRQMNDTDFKLLNMLSEYNVPFSIAITMTDATPRARLMKLVTRLEAEYGNTQGFQGVLLVSAHRKLGLTKLQNIISAFAHIPELGTVINKKFSFTNIVGELEPEDNVMNDIVSSEAKPDDSRGVQQEAWSKFYKKAGKNQKILPWDSFYSDNGELSRRKVEPSFSQA